MAIEVTVGDKDTPEQPLQQILVTVPGWLEKRISGRKKLNLKNLRLIAYDEADEIFLQEQNHVSIKNFYKHFGEIGAKPQTLMFSATYPENVINNILGFGIEYKGFQLKKESLKLKGVKQFYINLDPSNKLNFIQDIYL